MKTSPYPSQYSPKTSLKRMRIKMKNKPLTSVKRNEVLLDQAVIQDFANKDSTNSAKTLLISNFVVYRGRISLTKENSYHDEMQDNKESHRTGWTFCSRQDGPIGRKMKDGHG